MLAPTCSLDVLGDRVGGEASCRTAGGNTACQYKEPRSWNGFYRFLSTGFLILLPEAPVVSALAVGASSGWRLGPADTSRVS